MKTLSRLVAALGVAAALCAQPSPEIARAEGIDTTRPYTVVVGPPRGHAPSERVDARRTGQSKSRLPAVPVDKWRRHLGGTIEVAPVVDESGRIYTALTVPEVVAYSPDGKEVWRTRLGSAPAIAPPVLTSDGTLLLVTSAGAAVGLGRDGRVQFATPLGQRGRDLDVAPLARSDGSVVVGGRALVELDANGGVRARASLPERAVGALIEGPEGTIATGEAGGVYVFRPPNPPRKVGTFGGPLRRGAALEGGRTLLAVVNGKSLVGLDLKTGLTHVRAGDVGLGTYDEPVTIHPRGFAMFSTSTGLLFGVDAAGNERLRMVLDKGAQPAAPDPAAAPGTAAATGFFNAPADARPSPAMVVDAEGRVAFARQNGRVGVARPDGNVALVSEKLCAAPVAIQPAGDDKLVVACRDGTIWMLGI
ncbi:PQQ-binding-like beta-propeller repeat protein [Polyangium sp. 15x6]|uniref:outer membrane protein assembly factor BamB family protein n=1 Tax=Polyangium sp. 15x6 TaxID=3042687 RepID=UPI00249AE5E4|nr:PQQ-binding-like beta-propeller repeat protein [Polyangium sp. 15x6]MDI3291286.1 PQQ-binding-like beta-propeller repeat protein [Polyangium sp. 15x6]